MILGRMASVVSPRERVRNDCVPAAESGRARVWSRATIRGEAACARMCGCARGEAPASARVRAALARSTAATFELGVSVVCWSTSRIGPVCPAKRGIRGGPRAVVKRENLSRSPWPNSCASSSPSSRRLLGREARIHEPWAIGRESRRNWKKSNSVAPVPLDTSPPSRASRFAIRNLDPPPPWRCLCDTYTYTCARCFHEYPCPLHRHPAPARNPQRKGLQTEGGSETSKVSER